MKRGRDIATLRFVLGSHLGRMSAIMTQAQDSYLDIGRELAFFIQVGYRQYLAKDLEFRASWERYWSGAWQASLGDDDVVQDAKYRLEMELLGHACSIYTEHGLLMPTSTPWDLPNDAYAPDEEVVLDA